MPCNPVKIKPTFRGTRYLGLQGGKVSQTCLLQAGFLLDILRNPEVGDVPQKPRLVSPDYKLLRLHNHRCANLVSNKL
jgi:hypothetical protein